MVAIETYRDKQEVAEVIVADIGLEKIEKQRVALAKRLGFETQERVSYARALRTTIPYPRLSAEEMRIWHAYLPTAYADNLADYGYDDIPLGVLREYESAKNLKVFDGFVIMTPERQPRVHLDPVLLGYVDAHAAAGRGLLSKRWDYYLVARWGESLLPYEEIARIVGKEAQRAVYQSIWDILAPVGLILGGIGLLVLLVFMGLSWLMPV